MNELLEKYLPVVVMAMGMAIMWLVFGLIRGFWITVSVAFIATACDMVVMKMERDGRD